MPAFPEVFEYLTQNRGTWLESPRTPFTKGRKPQKFRILECDAEQERVTIQLESGMTVPLEFWRFVSAIDTLNSDDYTPIGSPGSDQYPKQTIESVLHSVAKEKDDRGAGRGTAPHVIDLLVLAGIAELGLTPSESGRKVQGARLREGRGQEESFTCLVCGYNLNPYYPYCPQCVTLRQPPGFRGEENKENRTK